MGGHDLHLDVLLEKQKFKYSSFFFCPSLLFLSQSGDANLLINDI